MENFTQFFHFISRMGVRDEMDTDLKKRLIHANRMSLMLSPFLLLALIINVLYFNLPAVVSFSLLLMLIVSVPLVNQFMESSLSRLLFCITPPFLTILPLAIFGPPRIGDYVAFAFVIIALTLLPLLLLHEKEEEDYFWPSLAFYLFSILFYDKILQIQDDAASSYEILTTDYYLFKVPQILLWLMLVFVVFSIKQTNTFFADQLKLSKQQLETQNDSLRTQAQKIETQNGLLIQQKHEIEQMNERLEDRVKQRTLELQYRNKQLAEYAFINAHLLRGPLCRIMGLLNVMEMQELSDEAKEMLNLLRKASGELDEVVEKIGAILEKGEDLTRHDLQQRGIG